LKSDTGRLSSLACSSAMVCGTGGVRISAAAVISLPASRYNSPPMVILMYGDDQSIQLDRNGFAERFRQGVHRRYPPPATMAVVFSGEPDRPPPLLLPLAEQGAVALGAGGAELGAMIDERLTKPPACHPPAEAPTFFHHYRPHPGTKQILCSRQSSHTGADDSDLNRSSSSHQRKRSRKRVIPKDRPELSKCMGKNGLAGCEQNFFVTNPHTNTTVDSLSLAVLCANPMSVSRLFSAGTPFHHSRLSNTIPSI
jgi:hypothetical protein